MNIAELQTDANKMRNVLNDLFQLSQGEFTPEIERLEIELADLHKVLAKKPDSAHWALKSMESDLEMLKQQKARIDAYIKTLQNSLSGFKAFLEECVRNSENGVIQGETVALKLKQNPAALKIINEDEIPAIYISEKTETVIDNAAIKKALKDGHEVPGAVLTVGQSLLISRPKK